MMRVVLLVLAVVALTACGEKPQVLGRTVLDTAAFEGTGTPFAASGWKAGDKTSWETQLRTRAQNSQNEYTKIN